MAISGHRCFFPLDEIRSVYSEQLDLFSSLSYILSHQPVSLLNRIVGSRVAASRVACVLRLLVLALVLIGLWCVPGLWYRLGVIGLFSLLLGLLVLPRASHALVLVRDGEFQSEESLIRSVVHVGSRAEVTGLQGKILLELHKRDLRDKRRQVPQNWQSVYASPFPAGVGARYRSDPADLFRGRHR
ncbi:hypothetical protein [Vulcanococcus limneticus]|uniref:hypothetical protein n=1 Tax=Vulcanococcus limneticus TaxID=2170428 RepID=UPI00398C23D6